MKQLPTREILRQLGEGETVAALCSEHGISSDDFHRWWSAELVRRVPDMQTSLQGAVNAEATIHRDAMGIPHILAENDQDLFFAFGLAMAQDRLFQLDYLRRRAIGRLSEVIGPGALPSDRIARTVGLHHIAENEWPRLSAETQQLIESFAAGVNQQIESAGDLLPIEFDLLDYRPGPWRPIDSLAIEVEFRWYLTGRFPVIVIPELVQRMLGDGRLYQQMLCGEEDGESILPPGSYDPGTGDPEAVGHVMSQPDEGIGSNNWAVAAERSTSGSPLVASDPHIAFEAVSCWYEVVLSGGSFNVAGMAYAGMPAVMFGRNEQVGWSITNNICSQRDLYQEKSDAGQPGCYLYDDQWIPARHHEETIEVRGEPAETIEIITTHNGPLVDKILPPEAENTGPVSLKWVGAYQGGWLTALLDMDRAGDLESFQEAARPWHVPTFSVIAADVDGHVGYLATGRIPWRNVAARGYRPGWDPDHQWRGYIPFAGMPRITDLPRGWIASANNRVVPPDYPYPMAGCWISGHRAARIREMIEARDTLSVDDFQTMQKDVLSRRAADCVPPLVAFLETREEADYRQIATLLGAWDCCSTRESAGPAIFNVFFKHWCQRIARERFPEEMVELLSHSCWGLATRLLRDDPHGWFDEGDRQQAILDAVDKMLRQGRELMGEDPASWQWGMLHQISLRHVLSGRGDLGALLDQPGHPVDGDMVSVGNTGEGPLWSATSGGGYRLIHDMGTSPPSMLAVDGQSQSGNPGSVHYADQFDDWDQGRYHQLVLDRDAAVASAVSSQRIQGT
jgi:penicillin amidase